MLVKVVTLFLAGMAILAMFGKLRLSLFGIKRVQKKCKSCGAPLVGKGGCPCGSPKA